MGYYDQDYKHIRQKQKGNRGGFFLAGSVGVILGVLLVIFALPAFDRLTTENFDPGGNETAGLNENQETVDTVPGQTVNVNVVSQVTQAVDRVSAAVVGVINIQTSGFWEEAGEAGTGSGVIYKKEDGRAYIVTNHHVIEGASSVEISLQDGSRIPGEVLGSDIFTDLAVISVDGDAIDTIAEFGNSDNVRPGEPVLAIGNPLGLQFSGSVTQGIISGTERTIPLDFDQDGHVDWQAEVLQTDAAINPGNSGGALVNIEGQIVGINSMKIAQEAVEGIGLSIPTTIVRPIISDIERYGEVKRPYMGVSLRNLSDISSYHWQQTLKLPSDVIAGVFLEEVIPLSPAEIAGLEVYDVIVALDGEDIQNALDLRKHLYNRKNIGDSMEVTFYRQGEKKTTTMRLVEESY
ncbi:serine protease Do [Bacillus mesophilus]|uniref:PDZ domain-containing protein n=1 Tax=Bacillus mesophilus TaxID=1808955 RepID=A0A6M0QDE6_9BACI|nr:serine protease Do [Bacillus mesophilus]NEY73118.1 PDZ domain-containing protein [Bacillus mesophilus]